MEISSRYEPKKTEKGILEDWLKSSLFDAKKDFSKKPYSIVIPPPNITGILHMGHALNNTLQDVLVRYQRMRGCQALWMPGTDHAGIATQNVVERSLAKEGLTKEDIGREEFTKRLWAWKDKYGSTIIDQLKEIGASCDWKRLRFTMDDSYSTAVKEVFLRLFRKGFIYRGNYIINWCPRCRTALSDEEAARKEVNDWLYYIRYPVETEKNISQKYIVVATTRPETMLGDTAVAVNPKDKRYYWLKGAKVILPVAKRCLPVIEDEAVDPEFGTGVVKVTPAHDPLDFTLGKKHNLDFINIMNEDATLGPNVAREFQNMDRQKARKLLLDRLKKENLLEKKEPHKLEAGHCYRCDTLVEPRLSLQWFVKMKPLAEKAIEVVEEGKIKFYPERWKKVYLNWMNNIQDWCISRQIWWGHRIPVWYCLDCYNPDNSSKGLIVSQKAPSECSDCGGKKLKQDEDVLDTWFSSWLWPFATFGWPFSFGNKSKEDEAEFNYFYPTKTLVTASEILFFWVARMIMASLEFTGQIPFSEVLIHGTVRDKQGVKMSKSLGNTIDPLEITKQYGADSLRFSLIFLAAGGSDVHLSPEKFLIGRNFANKLWNATRFIFSKIEKEKAKINKLNYQFEDEADEWVLKHLNETISSCAFCLQNYRIDEALKKNYFFFWNIFCDWYLEIIKDNFSQKKKGNSLFFLLASLRLLYPFIPFVSEEIFRLIKKNTNLNLPDFISECGWPQKKKLKADNGNINLFSELVESVKQIRDLRADLDLGEKKIFLEIKTAPGLDGFWEKHIHWFKKLTKAENLDFKKELKRIFLQNKHWSINLKIGAGDLTNFTKNLDKRINNFDRLLKSTQAKLKNEEFIANAPEKIVEKEKSKEKDFARELKRLKSLKGIII